jgi:predicted MFS family arabinose efflux permease
MTSDNILNQNETQKASWSGVWALTFGVSGIMIGEFLPAGLLTSIASDLKISEGMAGQSVTVTSIFAVIASLLVAYLTRNYNRKNVLIALAGFLTLSSLIAALAPNLEVLLLGRVLLGISLGGFWSMATAIAIRIVPKRDVPKALSVIFGGASFSSVLAAPLGSFLGNAIGWRNVFFISAALSLFSVAWIIIALPTLKPIGSVKLNTILKVIKIPTFKLGLLAIGLAFCGRFASITYLRPFLEQQTHLKGNAISFAFMFFDVFYFIGTLYAGKIVTKYFSSSLKWPPIVLAIACMGLIITGSYFIPTLLFLAILGMAFAPIPVVWSTWSAMTAPENTETAGGLYVASVQLAAAIGAFLGGVIFDYSGSNGVFAFCAFTWIMATMLVVGKMKSSTNQQVLVPTGGH